MPPKQKPDKAFAAAKAKQVEDKTFGLKNKNKSKAVQQYVTQLKNQGATNSAKQQRIAAQQGAANVKDKKKLEEERQKELAALFAVSIKQPKVPPGVDPKSMVCEFFRHGQCTKGFKCKFAHDLNVERKGMKIDLFTDQRDLEKEGEEGMADWDQETLEKVVNEKHGNEKPTNQTNIICKFFLDAVERKQYGWFWKCPNGGDCKYRHALPSGYVLKSQMKELLEEEAANQKDVAEAIEEERAKVDAKTPVTAEVFKKWHAKKMEEKRRKREEAEEERKRKGIVTGREMFMQEGFVLEDDASAADDYGRDDNDEEEEIKQMLARAQQAAQRARELAGQQGEYSAEPEPEDPGPSTSAAAGSNEAGPSTTLQLADEDEALFDDDDDDDDMDDEELDELEGQLREARVDDSEDG